MRRHTGIIIYGIALAAAAMLLWQGRSCGLFPIPVPGMDQEAMLTAAGKLAAGELPPATYRYSYGYTAFLAVLHLLTGGSPVIMRLLQAAVCATIPVLIYRGARLMRLGRTAGICGAMCYIFYAPALLISIDFLRAAPLALAFFGSFYLILVAWWKRSPRWIAGAGVLAALCVLGRENFAPVIILPALFWFSSGVRRHLGSKAIYWYLAAAILPIVAVMLFNGIRLGSFQPVPGNAANIMDFYHGEAHGGAERLFSLIRSVPHQFVNYLSNYELPNSLSVYAHQELIPFLKVFAVPFHLLTFLALTGVYFFRKNKAVQLAALLTAGYAGSLLFFTIFYRFRIPAIPLEAVLAGGGVAALLRQYRERHWKTLLAVILLGVLYLGLTGVAPDSRRPFEERAAVSRQMIELERYSEAEEYLARMTADGYDIRPGARLLAYRLWQAGDTAGAQKIVERFHLASPQPAAR